MSATMSVSSTASHQTVRKAACLRHSAALLPARPALRLRTLANARQRHSAPSQRHVVSCQHGRHTLSKTAKVYTPEVCTEEDLQKPVPAWQRITSFILKGAAVAALALVLVSAYCSSDSVVSLIKLVCQSAHQLCCLQTFGSISPAEAARSGGRMGGSGFSAARSGGMRYVNRRHLGPYA